MLMSELQEIRKGTEATLSCIGTPKD